MADFLQNREDRFQRNAFPAAGVSWGVPAPSLAVLQLERSLSPHPSLAHHHADIRQNTVVSDWHHDALPFIGQLGGGDRGITPFPAGNTVAQGQTQYPRHIDINMDHYHPPPSAERAAPHMYHDMGINNNAEVVRGYPAQAQVITPPAPEVLEYDIFGDAAQPAHASTAPDGRDAWPHEVPAPDATAEILRQLASRYLDHPGSQVDMVHVERDPAGRFRVIFALEIQVAAVL